MEKQFVGVTLHFFMMWSL